MASPIRELDDWILTAPFGVAPRKAQALWKLLKEKNVEFEFVDDAGFLFDSSSTETDGIIRASVPSLELLWCAAYCYWKMYQLSLSVQRRSEVTWTLTEQRERSEIERLYSWALVNVARATSEEWPLTLPIPGRHVVLGSDVHVATELFLVALGWILHHEVGHILHKHAFDETQRKRPRREKEWEADAGANRWLFDGVDDAAIQQKLALGAVTALCMLSARRQPGDDSTSQAEYPHPLERLVRSLDSSGVLRDGAPYAYGISALQMNMVLTHLTYVPLSTTAAFREQFEDLSHVIRTNRRSLLWAIIQTSDLSAYWNRRNAPLDHQETKELSYSLGERRGRSLWSADTDWYQAEEILRERRIEPEADPM